MTALDSLKVQVMKKAWAEPAFKSQLLAEPKKAIKEAFGDEIPEDVELRVVEESKYVFYLTLPPKPEDVADDRSNRNFVW
ncbi:hypothetical protein J19TS2_37040 [Cohnella xylanilytica]|uniref:NHLP leader peptide family natural product n=1 Tax=Cohnella xylanilytica TaxID=557555 RepID=A0A841TZZ9_9BACL|nr:NHLP leader peptide family RiPP precursor [Cohnella xylanilytica]MBB6693805.1 NHLP leader peptide family natural product precursor [Cohnella xylanilytica]GIO14149.1 hypothetical protein J19TS2_37040 [Cohnella xylanilytica]